MSRIIFAPICGECGYEFTELEFSLYTKKYCPKCGTILDSVVIPKYDTMVHMNNKSMEYVLRYSREDYY